MIYLEIILAVIGYFCLKGPARKKRWGELAVCAVIFLMGSALLILQTADVKMPYFMDEIEKFLGILPRNYG